MAQPQPGTYCLPSPTLHYRLRDLLNPIPHRRVGDRILVRVSEFDRWMDGFRVVGPKVPEHLQATVARARELAAQHAVRLGSPNARASSEGWARYAA